MEEYKFIEAFYKDGGRVEEEKSPLIWVWRKPRLFYGVFPHAHLSLKNMTNLLLAVLFFATMLCSCTNQTTTDKKEENPTVQKTDTTKQGSLHGIWVRHNKEGFTLIEINDTSDVSYYEFIDRKASIDTITQDRYWYYKSKATMGYWNNSNTTIRATVDIWIDTDKFRFDYRVKGDTLIEYDKMGEQGIFVKVYNDNK